jgi:hypothetical protein
VDRARRTASASARRDAAWTSTATKTWRIGASELLRAVDRVMTGAPRASRAWMMPSVGARHVVVAVVVVLATQRRGRLPLRAERLEGVGR